MKRSTNHILTTHTGSLPRPQDLVDMVLRKEKKQPVDNDLFAMRIRSAVVEVVRKQAEVGITVLNDGEQGKPGYSTYMKDRLTGFEGENTAAALSGEAKDFPEYTARRMGRAVPTPPRAPARSLGRIKTPSARTLKTCRPLSKKSQPKRYS